MRLLTEEERSRLFLVAEVARDVVEKVEVLVTTEPALALLTDWLPAVREKIDALEAGYRDGTDAGHLRPWSSGEFVRAVRSDPHLSEETARRLLAEIRRVEDETNAAFEMLAQRTESRSLLTLLGNVMGDFISVESALYGRFPALEPSVPE